MKSMMLKQFVVSMSLSGMALMTGCKKDEIVSPSATGGDPYAALYGHFDAFEIVTVDADALHDQFRTASEGSWKDISIPAGETESWSLSLTRSGLTPDGFLHEAENGSPLKTASGDEAITLEGLAGPDFQGESRLTVTRDFVSGFSVVHGEEIFIEPLALYIKDAEPGKCVVYRASAVRQNPGATCAEIAPPMSHLRMEEPSGDPLPMGATCHKMEVRAHGDYLFWRDKAGSNTSLAITTILSQLSYADSKFAAMGMDLVIPSGGVVISTAPDNYSADGATLLGQVRTYWNARPSVSRDLIVYFTNRDITTGGSTGLVGIAYTGVICKSLSYSYAVVETRTSAWTGRVTAHEMAHTLNAMHTSSCPGGLMYPSVNHSCTTESFTSASISQMRTYINSWNACLGTGACI